MQCSIDPATDRLRREQALVSNDDAARLASQLQQATPNSIDFFLSQNDRFHDVGKLAIAKVLLPLEARSLSLPAPSEGDWISFLFNQLAARTGDIVQNNVRFIIFNYDRLLIYHLTIKLSNLHSMPLAEAYAKVNSLPSWHPYGHLDHDYEPREPGSSSFCFCTDIGDREIAKASSGIDVLNAVRDTDDKRWDKPRDWLHNWAERAVFLGFGFDSVNCQRLGLGDGEGLPTTMDTIMSAYGMTSSEMCRACRKLGRIPLCRNGVFLPTKYNGHIDGMPFIPAHHREIAKSALVGEPEDDCLRVLRDFFDPDE